MSLELYLAYVAACILIVIVPGPTVTLIVANGLSYGTRAALLNVLGTQLGLATLLVVVAVGLATIVETMGWWFDWLRLIGAAYLVWLGWRLFCSSGRLDRPDTPPPTPRGGFVLQGYAVMISNPKGLLWFGAFIPQFVDPAGDYLAQLAFLGATAMAVAAVFDGAYAVLTGRAGALLSRARVRMVSRLSGLFLIAGGLWLALARTR